MRLNRFPAFATPNHWLALGTIWACQTGKDVYCEKPGTHKFGEGLKVMAAAEKYNWLVRHSEPHALQVLVFLIRVSTLRQWELVLVCKSWEKK